MVHKTSPPQVFTERDPGLLAPFLNGTSQRLPLQPVATPVGDEVLTLGLESCF